jgi:FkbM family methyltransferase
MNIAAHALAFYGNRLPNHPRKWWLHERLRRSLRAKADGSFDVVRQNLQWILNPNDFACKELFWLGMKDTWEIHHLKQIVRPASVILDVGANYGYYALTIANYLNGLCCIYAIEPQPSNYQRLQTHIEKNGFHNVICPLETAVSDDCGSAELSDQLGNTGHSQVVQSGGAFQVPVITLDRLCEQNKIQRIDAILLDVEGYEYRALIGARQILAEFKPTIVVELWEPVLRSHGTSPNDVVQLLRELGYDLYAPDKSRMRALNANPSGDQRVIAFCVHHERDRPGRWSESTQ